MQPDNLIIALNNVFAGKHSHTYSVANVRIAGPVSIKTTEDIETLLASFGSHVGWIARQSGVEVWRLEGREDAGDLGDILAAELGSDDHSVQIRRQPGAWVVTEFREGEGDTHIAEDISHITVRHGVLKYRRYWSLPEDGASEPVAARLVGIEGASK